MRGWVLPKGFHQLISKVAMPEKQIALQSGEMLQQFELVDEYLKQAMTSHLICSVN